MIRKRRNISVLKRIWNSGVSINKKVGLFIISDAFYYGGVDIPNSYLAVLITMQLSDGNIGAVGFAFTLTMLARGFSELPFTSITKKFNVSTKIYTVGICLILYGLFLILMGQSRQLWQVYLLQIGIGLVEGISFPLKWGIFSRIIDKGKEELEWGVEDVASTLLPALVAMLAGIFAGIVGLPALFFFFGLTMVTSGIVFLLIHRMNE